MDEQLLQNLRNAIDKNDHVAVLVGKNPTLDQMAAGLSFYLTLTHAGKEVTMLSASEPTVEVGSLVGIDKVKTTYSSQEGDLIVSFPYKDGEIDKVSYNQDEDKHILNIVVTAGELGLSFNEQDVTFSRGSGAITLLITIGTAHLDDVYSVITPESLTDATIINVDNVEGNERYGEINLVSSRFSSLSEQVADLLLTLGYDPEMDQDISQNLFSGIVSGTSNFQNQNTSYLAFEIAAILMKKGAQRTSVMTTNPQVANEFMSFMQQGGNKQPQKNQNQQSQQQHDQNRRPQQPQAQKQQNNQNIQKQNSSGNMPKQNNQPQMQQSVQPTPVDDFSSPAKPGFNTDFQDIQAQAPISQAPVTPMQNPQPKQQQQGNSNPPADWLTPKVYKGSTNV
jgi:nanoRNase/pAp phosphatase (c-di-AMP/oligoRNAs hydrolase)